MTFLEILMGFAIGLVVYLSGKVIYDVLRHDIDGESILYVCVFIGFAGFCIKVGFDRWLTY